jgi:GDP-4-dehydro-6-deoxy-D-mannose reductase
MNIPQDITAVILAGGLGTRLRPITETIPKVMVDVDGKPFLEYKLEMLKKYGIKKIILCIGYLGEKVKNYFGDGKNFGLDITYAYEKELLGTAGAIKNAEHLIKTDYFIVTNGDTYLDINFQDMIFTHKNFNYPITMAVSQATNPVEQELIKLQNREITGFYRRETKEHKEELNKNKKPLMNAGTYILNKEVLKIIPLNKHVSLEKEIFPLFVGKIMGFVHEGYIKDITNSQFYEEFKEDLKKDFNKPILEIKPSESLKTTGEINSKDKMRILVTGAGGMMGSHMLDFLIAKGHKVLGIDFIPTTELRELNKEASYIECDIRDKDKLTNILNQFKPEIIFHLAAQSFPTVSWERPEYTIQTNILGTVNLFEAVKQLKLDSIILNAGSSAEYGYVNENEVPIKEERELRPLHPYGISKLAQELLAYQYYKNFGIKSVTIRIFNTTGPKKINDVCSDFTRQIVMMEKGFQNPVLKVGNINTKRTITDVRDMIEGFWLAVNKCEFGERYNISGDKIYLIKDIIEILRELTLVKFDIAVDQNLIRPTDEPVIYGDSTRFKEKTGWHQKIEIRTTLNDMLNYWRQKK